MTTQRLTLPVLGVRLQHAGHPRRGRLVIPVLQTGYQPGDRRVAHGSQFGLGVDTTPMGLALMLWFCTLPLVLILVLPFFGWQVAIWTAVALLVVAFMICRGICADLHQ